MKKTHLSATGQPAEMACLRVDAREKLSGRPPFAVDLTPPGCLHARVIRAGIPHGRLRRITFDPAVDWSAFTILTAADIPGGNAVPMVRNDQPFLAADTTRYAGEPVVLLAHDDPSRLAKIHQFIQIELDPLPAVLTLAEADSGTVDITGHGNLLHSLQIEKGEPEKVTGSPEHRIFEAVYETGHQEHLYLEPQNMLAWHEDGKLRVTGSLQCPYYVKAAVENALGFPVDIVQAPTGGAFGGKEDYPSLMAAWVALLAWKTKRPVKMVFSREEDLAFTTKRHPSRTRLRTAVDASGKLLAMEADFTLDGGAYCTLSPVVLSRGAIHLGGPYHIPHQRIRARVLATNTPPNGAFRGFGAPQAFFALERHMDVMARQLGLDPVHFRQINLLKNGQTMATGQPFVWEDNLRQVLKTGLQTSRYRQRQTACRRWNRTHPQRPRGIGLALFFHGAGFTGGGEKKMQSSARLELQRDGRVIIRAANTEIGQGARTALARMVARVLEIPVSLVEYPYPDTALVPNSGPTVASRTTFIVGGLLENAARQLRQRLAAAGCAWHGEDGYQQALAGWPALDFPVRSEWTYQPPPGVEWDEASHRGHAYADYSWACYIAEIEASRRDGSVRVLRFTAVQDIGTVVVPDLARGQVEGGIAQGIGHALLEKIHWQDGRVANPSFSDYLVPAAADVPPLTCVFLENPSPAGGLGAKGLGELPLDGTAAALINALSQAWQREIFAIPCLPPDLLELKP